MPAKGTTRPKPHPGTRAKEVSTTVPAEGTTLFENFIMLTFKFQLPCPRRARQSPLHGPQPSSEFQLPCPRRARLLPGPAAFGSKKFQLPCPRRARQSPLHGPQPSSEFQLPCPRRARLLPGPAAFGSKKFQLPCPRRARREFCPIACVREVSTTVPAEGTTYYQTTTREGVPFQLPCPRRARRLPIK